MQILQPKNENLPLQEKKAWNLWCCERGTRECERTVSRFKWRNQQNLPKEGGNGPPKENVSLILEAQH